MSPCAMSRILCFILFILYRLGYMGMGVCLFTSLHFYLTQLQYDVCQGMLDKLCSFDTYKDG